MKAILKNTAKVEHETISSATISKVNQKIKMDSLLRERGFKNVATIGYFNFYQSTNKAKNNYKLKVYYFNAINDKNELVEKDISFFLDDRDIENGIINLIKKDYIENEGDLI